MARIAIIDLGTNSVRFDVHELAKNGNYRTLFREKLMVRLGQDVFSKGKLNNQAVQRTVRAFLDFHKIIKNLHVKRVIAFGTSALREAADAKRLISAVKKATGIEIRVISGADEARLIALGILSNEKVKTGTRKFGLVDIGGGSTEVSICKARKALYSVSLPLGTARLQQVYLRKTPPSAEAVHKLREEIKRVMRAVALAAHGEIPRISTVIGSSGTVRALAKVLRKKNDDRSFKLRDLKKLNLRMTEMSTGELISIPGMDLKRVDMILSGSILLEECASFLGAKKIIASEYSLRDGIIREQAAAPTAKAGANLLVHIDDIVLWARRFGITEKKARATIRLATNLFRSSKSLHKLPPNWEAYLVAASILRRTGEVVSPIGYGNHTAYFVHNAMFPFIEDWETHLIAEVCRYSDRTIASIPMGKQLKHMHLPREFLPLTGMLALVEALDIDGPNGGGTIRLKHRQTKVYLSKPGLSTSGLEAMRLQQRARLFKKTFGKKIEITRC